ncbi:MAG: hypothetical protein EXS58_10905 [Candidatus Latescibacteria bacterium]|nr:hypothetical protein [Candidatus Latescibacterota bacterium]
MSQMSVPLSKDELEALIRRVVREEFLHLVGASGSLLLNDNCHEVLGNPKEERQQLRAAAEALLPDYAGGSELTAFTALDSKEFHAQG